MKVEIITIGDEIIIGQIHNTNSTWIASELSVHGFEIIAITSVGDKQEDILKALDIGFERAQILLLTGGIGPTKDDITKSTLSTFFNSKLILDTSVLENINKLLKHKQYALNELTKNQALVPENCQVIQNQVGTAPILWFEHKGKILVSMPGVPFEMKRAMKNDVIPKLLTHFTTEDFHQQTYMVSGITESDLALRLEKFENELPRGFSLAYLPAYGIIRLRLSLRGKYQKETFLLHVEKLKNIIHDLLIDSSGEAVEILLGRLLKAKNLTVSTAESCTGGYIAHRITRIAGSSDYFLGSVISYANDIKINLLNVEASVIKKKGVVSSEVAEQMASNCAKIMKTDCCIAVSGIAGPGGATPGKPVGTVWICTYWKGEKMSRKYQFGTSREENIHRATEMGILQLIKMLNEK